MAQRHIPPDGRERRVPGMRERCQEGFELLCGLLARAGHHDLLDRLGGYDTVDEVLRMRPESVHLLLEAAWELRGERAFLPFFRHKETGVLVDDRDAPIAPCGRTFNQVIQAHLYGAARLHFSHQEKQWAKERARKEEHAHRKREAKRRTTVGGRFMGMIRDHLDDPPRFPYRNYRVQYPGYGLYDRLKPYLRHSSQFALIPHYAQLRSRQVDALGDLIANLTTAGELAILAALDDGDIGMIRGVARAFAETKLGVEPRRAGPSSRRAARQAEDQTAQQAAVREEEKRVFDLLLSRHVGSLPRLREAGSGVETTIRRLTPVFGDDLWDLFGDEAALNNAVNCPDLILDIVGPIARAIPVAVSAYLMAVQDKLLLKDILRLAMETFAPEKLEEYFADPARRPIWDSLPAKFNNNYRYQANAPNDSTTVKNHENLRMVCTGIFAALETGKLETL